MITINGEPAEHEEGLTVSALLKKKKFVFPMLLVRINGKLVEREEYDSTLVAEGDAVEVIHLMSGG